MGVVARGAHRRARRRHVHRPVRVAEAERNEARRDGGARTTRWCMGRTRHLTHRRSTAGRRPEADRRRGQSAALLRRASTTSPPPQARHRPRPARRDLRQRGTDGGAATCTRQRDERWRSPAAHRTGVQVRLAWRRPARRRVFGRRGLALSAAAMDGCAPSRGGHAQARCLVPDLAGPGLIAVHALSSAAFMPLTPREARHRWRRAAAGTGNREIAEDLGIAERTVENHLARRYDKLHVHTRSGLRTALGLDRSYVATIRLCIAGERSSAGVSSWPRW